MGAGFNRDKWEHLERYTLIKMAIYHTWNMLKIDKKRAKKFTFCYRYTRGLTKVYRNVYVCTGPLYLPKADPEDGKSYIKYQVIGKNNVAVPTHFFKVVVGEMEGSRDLEMEAYVLPNEKIPDHVPIQTFQVST